MKTDKMEPKNLINNKQKSTQLKPDTSYKTGNNTSWLQAQ